MLIFSMEAEKSLLIILCKLLYDSSALMMTTSQGNLCMLKRKHLEQQETDFPLITVLCQCTLFFSQI